ncbi:MAG: hypothetical protein R3B36_10765 [Polyangiaceae bacterium]
MTMRERAVWVAATFFVLTGCAGANATGAPAAQPPRDTELPAGSFSGEGEATPPEEPQAVVLPRLSRTLTLGAQDNAAWTQERARASSPAQPAVQLAFAPTAVPRPVSPARRDLFAEDAAQAPVTRRITASGYRSVRWGGSSRTHGASRSFGGSFGRSGGSSRGGSMHR